MGFAVYHTSKGRGSGGALGNHIDRVEGKEHSYKNSDPLKNHLNKEFCPRRYKDFSLQKAVDLRISEGYRGNRKIRSDAVRYITHILSGSHKDMIEIFDDEKKKENWIKENAKFVSREFGTQNVIRFTLHLDEKTPHIHCVTVPLTKDGRLSAKEVIGNRKKLEQRQDRYAEMMQKFGFKRGLKGSAAKHKTTAEYRKELDKAIREADQKSKIKRFSSTLGFYRGSDMDLMRKSLESTQKALIEAKTRSEMKSKDLSYSSSKIKHLERQNEALEMESLENLKKSQENLKRFKNYEEILLDVLRYEEELKKIREVNNIIPKQKKPKKQFKTQMEPKQEQNQTRKNRGRRM